MCTTITSIEIQKKNKHRYNIYLDESYAFSVHEDIIVKHKLVKGKQIQQESLQQVIYDDELQKAYHTAIRYITKKARTEKEISTKLFQKGYEPDHIAEVIEKLVSHQYINDEDYAVMLTKHRIMSHKKGRNWVKQELSNKGIKPEYTEQAIREIDDEVEYKAALEQALKKWSQKKGEPLEKKKSVSDFLLRRGYTYSTVNRVLREVQGNDNGEEWESYED